MVKFFTAFVMSSLLYATIADEQEGGPVSTVRVPERGTFRDPKVIEAWVDKCREAPRSCDRDEYEVRGWGRERFELFAEDPKSYEQMAQVSANIVLVIRQN